MNEETKPELSSLPPVFKMQVGDIVKTLQSYAAQADGTLNQLQSNIDTYTKQISEWNKMQIMIVGQKQLIADILSKTVELPVETKSDAINKQ
jgi:hypothetical protein